VLLLLISILVVWVLACAFAAVLCAAALRGESFLRMHRPAAAERDAAPMAGLRAS
jgi:hypothetical protein